MKIWAFLLVFLLAGCTQEYNIKQTEFKVQVYEAPKLKTEGLAIWGKGWCKIFLRNYPELLGHEMRHCIEGHWHSLNKPNGEDY